MVVKNKPTIAFLKNHLGGSKEGGLEKQTWRLANAFLHNNCDVTLLTSSKLQSPNIHVIQLPCSKSCSFYNLLSFDRSCSKFFKKNEFDIVFGLDRNTFQTHLRAGNGVHAKYLELRQNLESLSKSLSFYINPLHKILLNIEKKGFENPLLKVLLTNSHMVKEQILQYYKVDENKIKVVHNGVEWTQFQEDFNNFSEAKKAFIQKENLPRDRFFFLFAGHDFKRKGLEVVLKALSTFKEDSYFLCIAGKDRNEAEFVSLAKKLGISHNIKFFGKIANMTPFYQLVDCLIIPSFYDPFANVTLEALAMGVPVITSQNNGAKEILSLNSGYILSQIAVDEMAHYMQKILKRPKTLLSASNIRSSVRHLDFPQQLQQVVDLCLK